MPKKSINVSVALQLKFYTFFVSLLLSPKLFADFIYTLSLLRKSDITHCSIVLVG